MNEHFESNKSINPRFNCSLDARYFNLKNRLFLCKTVNISYREASNDVNSRQIEYYF